MLSGVIWSLVRSRQELCSPGGLRQGCEILEDREGGLGEESAQARLYDRVVPVEKEVLLSCLFILNLMTMTLCTIQFY